MTRLDGDVERRLAPGPPEASGRPDDADAVEAHWRDHLREHPAAFDGRILDVRRVEGRRVTVRPSSYRLWIARGRAARAGTAAPAAAEPIRPLAVTGLLRIAGGVLLARRAASALQDAGRWELAPSGIVDGRALDAGPLAAREQLAVELREELALAAGDARSCTAIALVPDPSSTVIDVLFQVDVGLPADEVLRRFAVRRSSEYDDVRVVSENELAGILGREGADVSRAARLMLAVAGLVPEERARGALRPARRLRRD